MTSPSSSALQLWDGRLSEDVTDLRWSVLTPFMELLSSWWIKGPLFVLAILVVEVATRRCVGRPLLAAASTVVAVLVGSAFSTVAKLYFDRPRPPLGDAGISSLVTLPSSSSFPSGHATTAFAAAAAVSMLRPSLRRWALAVAAGVAVSRVYLGVHYVGDVLAGAALGGTIGILVVLAVRRVERAPLVTGSSA